MVWILGQPRDVHIEKVSAALSRMGRQFACFERYHPSSKMTLQFNGTSSTQTSHAASCPPFSLSDVASVWWRMKPYLASELTGGAGPITERFIVREWGQLFKALPVFLPHAKWVNPLRESDLMSAKPCQLQRASALGLMVPNTVISNIIEDVLPLFDKHKHVVYKPLHSFTAPPAYAIYTTKIARQDINKSQESFTLTPGIFQAYIEKAYELRVTIIRDRVFTAQIDSQSAEETSVDWRRNQLRPMYKPGSLSKQTLDLLLRFHSTAGLVYAAYDFIVDKEGREVFLECNPGGQWLWIEDALGFPISKEIAGELAHA